MRRVVVTGIGLLTSLGNNKDISWKNLIDTKSGIKKIDQFDVSDLPAKIAGYIDNNPQSPNYFNSSSYLEIKDIKRNDRFIQYGLVAAKMAIDNDKKPDEILTVFAGFHTEATNQVRKYCLPYPPSSPSMALFKEGKLVHFIERHHIEGQPAEVIAENEND